MEQSSFDFNSGLPMMESSIQRWHNELLKEAVEGNYGFYSKCSGNSIVIAHKTRYSNEPDNDVIVIYEIKNGYKKFEYKNIKNNDHEQ